MIYNQMFQFLYIYFINQSINFIKNQQFLIQRSNSL